MLQQQPESLQRILSAIQALMEAEIYPLEKEFLDTHTSFRSLLPHLTAIREQVKVAGLWAPHLPAAYGGMGLALHEFAHVSELLGRSPLGHYLFNCQAPDIGNMELLLEYGSEAQRETYLAPLASGEIRSCFAMTEPEFPGSNPAWLGATAEKSGGDYVINGHKWFTTAADGAAFTVVMALTEPEAENKYARASMIIVPAGTPGYRLVRNIPVMGETGDDYATHGEVIFEDCRVPQSNRIGAEGAGFMLAQARLGPGRVHHCMRWIGICERAFDLMCRHAAGRRVAPGVLLGTQGMVQSWIAESRAEINAARLMVLQVAARLEAEGQYAARDDISLIKFFVAGILQKVLDRAIQVHGGLGVTDYTPLAYWYRHERAARIYDGPDEVHKMAVARRILRRYVDTEQ